MDSNKHDIEKEFKDFVYIVSHDFRAPVRHVKEFTRLMNEAIERGDEASVETYRSYITQSADKMERMLDAILLYSRINTQPTPPEMIDMDDVLSRVFDRLEVHHPRARDIIRIEKTVSFWADPSQFEDVFYYLLDNALEYNDKGAEARVSLVGEETSEGVSYIVKDNGIGIPEIALDQVFVMYRQMKPNQDGHNIGAGLALVKKIIDRHDGSVSIKSTVGEGTEVAFTVPKKA